ncbi:glutathione S-transferase family protein [Tropicimonas isoalkanivorans]|uniref:Glutathione S-transferase n=1 Tax=Tropicimonas isoalkanivorans TaxID=441112 RepID=A0A1I1HRT8_9RHOB|nr:glutathione S-transferase family protein [Tropicimonas isoalkanivorans]SFC26849.1 Glutathione S-transferase [Tropicimonas isoalkanivorans]
MTRWRLFGSDHSPYSVKLRSYMRFKGLPVDWVPRTAETRAEFDSLAKLPLLPLLVAPDGTVMQDSTPVILALERRFPEPAIFPDDEGLRFVSMLIEEAADEWGNRLLAAFRWTHDRAESLSRTARMRLPHGTQAEIAAEIERIETTRLPKIFEVAGIEPGNAAAFEASLTGLSAALDKALKDRRFLMGDRPSLADFGLWGQVVQMRLDPTAGKWLAATPAVSRWLDRMMTPACEGIFAPAAETRKVLHPLLAWIAEDFLPWSLANMRAATTGEPDFQARLLGGGFRARSQRYSAKSLRSLIGAMPVAIDPDIALLLEETGCIPHLAAARNHFASYSQGNTA